MAYEHTGTRHSKPAGVDLSLKQYHFAKDDGTGQYVTAGDGDVVSGALINDPEQGQMATIQSNDEVLVVAGAALSIGDVVASDANGQAKLAGSGDHPAGQVQIASGGAGEVITVKLEIGLTPLA